MIGDAGLPSNPLVDLGLANWIKEIYSTSHMWRAIAKLMKAIPIAPVSNKEIVLILFILPRLHATTKASLVNKLPDRLKAEINNGFSPLTATFIGAICFPPPRDQVKVQSSR